MPVAVVVISNPISSAPFQILFFCPLSFTISSHGITTHGHVSFLFLFSHFPPFFSFILLPSFPFVNKQELGKLYFYFFFFFVSFSMSLYHLSVSVSVPRTSYL
jgi:hypothetical protein